MVTACGIVMSCAASIKNSTGFILFRLFLGLAESGKSGMTDLSGVMRKGIVDR
jgi:hypothetical protein